MRRAILVLLLAANAATFVVAQSDKLGMFHRALKDDRLFGLVVGEAKRFVEERLVGENALAFDAAGGGNDSLGPGVVDAHRK